ncbi:hypothetical protein TB2_032450 [Malus domestica]
MVAGYSSKGHAGVQRNPSRSWVSNVGRRDKRNRMGWLLVLQAGVKTEPNKHESLLVWTDTGNRSSKPRRLLQTGRGFRPVSGTCPTCF